MAAARGERLIPPLLDRQRRGVQLGSIRIGVRVTATNAQGKTYTRPKKLDTFRLTSPDRHKIEAAAELYGGEVQPWKSSESAAQQWEVLTTVDRMPVRVPPGEPVEQHYMLFGGRPPVRQRLCDGLTEKMRGGTCICPPDLMERKRLAADGAACKPVTRLSLVLADLPGLGVWSLTSTGDAAADELASVAELLRQSAAAGMMMPATLRLEQRESRGSGEVHRFAVPVLDVGASLVALESGHVPMPQLATPVRSAIEAPTETVVEGVIVDEPPHGMPSTAQHTAEAAKLAATPDDVKRLGAYARERGWMNDDVLGPDGLSARLENVLYEHLERVGGLG